jgi:hypothetical protein
MRQVQWAALALAAALSQGHALADALPPPMELNEVQKALLGCWQQDGFSGSQGRGHYSATQIVCFANDQITIVYFSGIDYSRYYQTTAVLGSWSGERARDGTITVTLDQSEGRGTVLTLTPDGDSYMFSDAENGLYAPGRITRIVTPKTE